MHLLIFVAVLLALIAYFSLFGYMGHRWRNSVEEGIVVSIVVILVMSFLSLIGFALWTIT